VSLRARTFFSAALAAGALLLAIWSSPAGASVPKLTGQITDEAGVLGTDRARVQTGLDDLFETGGIRLWVVFAGSTNASRATDVARQLFEENELSGHAMLLVVAVDDHRYGWWERTIGASDIGEATGLSSYEIDALLSAGVEPRFRAGDYAGGIVSLVYELEGAVRATPYPTYVAAGGNVGEPDDPDPDGWLLLFPLLMGLAVLAIIVLAAVSARSATGSGGAWSGSGSSGSTDWGSSSSSSSSSSSDSGGYSSSDDSSGHGGGGGWTDSTSGSSGHGGGGGW
jgi:hypothetical protein